MFTYDFVCSGDQIVPFALRSIVSALGIAMLSVTFVDVDVVDAEDDDEVNEQCVDALASVSTDSPAELSFRSLSSQRGPRERFAGRAQAKLTWGRGRE